ncbi:uncharacterized protein N7459_008159 [Penicillium hispanicum]|uniref:uncharacterized protein n=1 Tax=Penicillium hispanicum TaxID=1080232 RepID=UPI00254229E0|nr:uncharacterized protein N7459_008159 [Penicillium hispanicum]KAJ5573732.1 hypothetical protein N7459_008159 [Penicillium hispanicum]
MTIPPLPPPLPPPPPAGNKAQAVTTTPKPPVVTTTGPQGAFKVELLIFNGHPYKDHWAYWFESRSDPDVGVVIHVVGDVRKGFEFQIKRSHDFKLTNSQPTKRISLQWIDGKYLDERAMFNNGECKVDKHPVCAFEASAHKVQPPAGSLNSISEASLLSFLAMSIPVNPSDQANRVGRRVVQRDCQTWIVESADQLVRDGILTEGVRQYLRAIQQ